MSDAWKVGDRVRVTRRNRMAGYFPGDRGRVRKVAKKSSISGVIYYAVSTDRNAHAWNVLFKAHETELDV
jgi:hypothetical protein